LNKTLLTLVSAITGLIATAPAGYAQDDSPVQYVKICSLYGAGFHYIAGTDICINDLNGDARQQTEGGTWRTYLPYKEGTYVTNQPQACTPDGKLMKVGDFKSTDFTMNAWGKMQSFAVNFPLQPPAFISKVMMSGGFYDPRVPLGRSGTNSVTALCLRSIDPDVFEKFGDNLLNPPFGLGLLPIACISGSRFHNMPGSYAITAQGAYPQIDQGFTTADQSVTPPAYTYGDQLVLTTDIFSHGLGQLSYHDSVTDTDKPLAGTVSVSVCVNGN